MKPNFNFKQTLIVVALIILTIASLDLTKAQDKQASSTPVATPTPGGHTPTLKTFTIVRSEVAQATASAREKVARLQAELTLAQRDVQDQTFLFIEQKTKLSKLALENYDIDESDQTKIIIKEKPSVASTVPVNLPK